MRISILIFSVIVMFGSFGVAIYAVAAGFPIYAVPNVFCGLCLLVGVSLQLALGSK